MQSAKSKHELTPDNIYLGLLCAARIDTHYIEFLREKGKVPRMLNRIVERSVVVAATPWTIWRVLTDFSAWQRWNPFMPSMQGTAEAGQDVEALIRLWGNSPSPYMLRVQQADFCRQLVLTGSFRMPGLADVIHCFIIAQLDSHTSRFTHGLRVSGIFVPLLAGRIGRAAGQGMETMNISLKAVAQARR